MNYTRIAHPDGHKIHCVTFSEWVFGDIDVTLKSRTDGENEITIQIPRVAGLEVEVVESNGALALHATKAPTRRLCELSHLPIIVRVPPASRSGMRTFQVKCSD